jgi:hypothetical protein
MNTFLIMLGIYLAGWVCSYYSLKFINFLDAKIEKTKFEYDWEDIGFWAKVSLFSWITFLLLWIIFPIAVLEEKYGKKIKNYFKTSKPPKWL